jgi:alpha-beta hydrolase superfamily lysophospholipase
MSRDAKHEEGALTQRAVPGPSLYWTGAMPAAPPRVVVGVLHGYAEHGARYRQAMDVWASQGVGSVAIDLRGHGRATGRRGYCARFEEYLDDSTELYRLVGERANGAPVFLFGHSFGGLVASMSVLESTRSWRGLVLSSPFFELAMTPPALKVVAGKVASRLMPKLAMPSGLSGAQVTHVAAKAREYEEDPLVFKTVTARWFTETQGAQARALGRAKELTLPLLVVVGGADPIASVPGAKRFFEAAGSADKTWDERAGLYHETLNEAEGDDIARAMGEWMVKRAG